MYSLLVYSECSSVTGCGSEWHIPVNCDSADLLKTFFVHLLHHCKGDNSDSYDFINLVMCFVNKSQIKFFLNILLSMLCADLILSKDQIRCNPGCALNNVKCM